jgi:nucleotide-binding universal stress UspA family protein
MKILIAYDGSSHADAAIDDLRRAGLPREVEAVVVSVADVWVAPASPSEYEAVQTPLDEQIRARAQWFRQQATKALGEAQGLAHAAREQVLGYFPAWEVQTEVRSGSPGSELIRKADDWQPDLLVVGSQGRSGLGRLFLGSVSQEGGDRSPLLGACRAQQC